MWEKLLDRLGTLAAKRGGTVAIIVLLVTVAMALAIPGLRISSSYRDLMPKDRPEQREYDEFLEEFGAANDFVVVLEGEPEEIRRAADGLALRLSERTRPIADVFYRFDIEDLAGKAPLYLDEARLEKTLASLAGQKPLIDSLATVDSLPALLERIGALFANPDEDAALDPATAVTAVEGMNAWLDSWLGRIDGKETSLFEWPGLDMADAGSSGLAETLESRGYLGSRDYRMVFLFVRPDRFSDDPAYLATVEKAILEEWEALRITDSTVTDPVKIAFTGLPAHILTDVRSLRQDIIRSAGPSAVLVFLILWIGLRSVRRTLVALAALGCGLAISLGVARFVFVELNRMSMSFLAIMFGIGIDFAIYLVRRTDEEIARGRDREGAVKRALQTCGQGIIAGGLVTALAFTATATSEFRGTSQLGLTTGLSVVIVLVTTLLFLPPVLMRARAPERFRAPPDESEIAGSSKLASTRRLGFGVLAAVGILVLGAILAPRIPVDYNGLSVMPRNAESTEYQLRMQEESDFQMSAGVIRAEDAASLATIVEKVRALPSVSRVVSLGDLLPTQQEEKLEILARYADSLPEALPRWDPSGSPSNTADYLDGLAAMEEGLYEAQDLAFAGGRAELTAALQGTIDRVEKLAASFGERPEETLGATLAMEQELADLLLLASQSLASWKTLRPITEESLPSGFVNRFRSPLGNYAAFVYPKGSIWDVDVLETFLGEIRSVTPDVTGFPVLSLSNVSLLTRGIFESLLLTIGVVVILLSIDLRSPKLVLFALFPLLVGMALLQIVLFVTGQQYNLASINGLPLLLGLGVVYGVHLVHRWSEAPDQSAFLAVRTSGRAIGLAGVTTMAGLASLTFCVHRGVATFGWLLLQGIVCMLVAGLVALPILIDWVSARERDAAKQADS